MLLDLTMTFVNDSTPLLRPPSSVITRDRPAM